jgi:hypothetical protein
MAQRPAGDLLEEIVSRGPAEFARYLGHYTSLGVANRIAVLLGGLSLGPEVATDWRSRLSSRDSAEKRALAIGLGQIGHPDVDAYLARLVRERPSAEAAAAALRGLGRIGSPRTLPLVLGALDDELLLPAACEALALYGGKEAVGALLARTDRPPALRALARLGADEARGAFLEALEGEGPAKAEGAWGVGRLGDPTLGHLLVPYLASEDEGILRAAWEGYVALGAPLGADPLLRRVETHPTPWMPELLAGLDRPEIHSFFAACLAEAAPVAFWKRLRFWKRGRPPIDRRAILRGLRGTEDPAVLAKLLLLLQTETDACAVREILESPALARHPEFEAAVAGLWRRGELVLMYLAARSLLRNPSVGMLAEAIGFLGLPGFCELDRASPLTDPEHLLRVFAQENNPFLLLGGFLDSGLLPLDEVARALEAQLAKSAFPAATAPTEGFARSEGRSVGTFLEAFGAALPGQRWELNRLWNVLAQTQVGSESFLDLFLCHTGAHRGGLQRLILRELPGALGHLLLGKDDRFLPDLDRLAERLPPEGPFRSAVAPVLEKCRRALMAECRDLVVFDEKMPKGDMVVIAHL